MQSEELENAEVVHDPQADLEQAVTVATKAIQSEEQKKLAVISYTDAKIVEQEIPQPKIASATQVVTADFVQAEDVPTIPIASLQTISSLQPEISVHSVASTHAVSLPSPLVAPPTEYQRGLKEWMQIWLNGTRLNYLPLSLSPILLGSVLAWTSTIVPKKPFGSFHLVHFLGTIVFVILLQVGAHLVNDYYDFLHGVDTSNALGPGGLIQQGYIKHMRVLEMGLLLLGMGTAIGMVLAINGSILLYLFGLIGVLCAFFYSATSRSLSSKVLGEFVVFIIFGPILTLDAYMVQVGPHFPANVFLYSLVVGFLAIATVHANNMRDIEGDALAGKHTLATVVGLPVSRVLYLLLVLAAYGIILGLGLPPKAPHLILLTFWTVPTLIIAIISAMRTNAPTGFHLVMSLTLKLEVLFTILLMTGLIVTSIIHILPYLPLSIPKV
jgi:1,4-dihydroxy-2-naphthoate octaprenyltransferase